MIDTASEHTYRAIRQDIIHGKLAPRIRLRLDSLRETYGASVSTLREILNRLTGEGPVNLATSEVFTLAKGEKQTKAFSFTTGEVGIGAVSLSVEGPEGFKVSRSYPIQSRTPYFPVTEVRTAALNPGETFQLSKAVTEPFVPGSAEVSVGFSRLNGIEPGPLLDALYRYPYGCSEQLTSSALPLLFVDVLGGEIGRGPERAVRPRVQNAVNQLLDRQSPDGAIGLWRVGDRWASPWLGAYRSIALTIRLRTLPASIAGILRAIRRRCRSLTAITTRGNICAADPPRMRFTCWPVRAAPTFPICVTSTTPCSMKRRARWRALISAPLWR